MKSPVAPSNGPIPRTVLPLVAPNQIVVGLDEVGRGAWAGPLVMAAVVFGPNAPVGVTDSKLLSALQRTRLARHIKLCAAGIGLGWVPVAELDQLGLAASLRTAARRAIHALACAYDTIIIDGTVNFLPDERAVTMPKADFLIPQVAAASIVAKVARDNYMRCLHRADERYGFDRHVGYGTAHHQTMLRLYGPSLQHRRSFRPIREML